MIKFKTNKGRCEASTNTFQKIRWIGVRKNVDILSFHNVVSLDQKKKSISSFLFFLFYFIFILFLFYFYFILFYFILFIFIFIFVFVLFLLNSKNRYLS